MKLKFSLIIICLAVLSLMARGQDSIISKKVNINESQLRNTNVAVKNLSKSLESNKSDKEIADDYMQLAKELIEQNDYARAKNYFTQAINLYSKGKNKELLANSYRELAKVEEQDNNYDVAYSYYMRASETTKKKQFRTINQNDAYRIANVDLQSKSQLIQSNISHFNSGGDRREVANAYQQLAEVRLKMDDKEGAIVEFQNALENVKDNPREAIKIQEEIAKTYLADEQFDKAIVLNQALVEEAQKTNDPAVVIKQQVNLSNTYFEANEEEKALLSLKEAYEFAVHNGQTLEAKNILKQLGDAYRKQKKTNEVILLYEGFINELDSLLKSDSTLIDKKFFQVHEDRIARLERERVLQEELIQKTNTFNYILIGFIILILIFLFLIAKSLYSINKKNKRIALQSLRREMNPHFIFNSLNSVNHFIAQNKELEANKYLSSYSKLMRNIMENSNKDFIPLSTEIEQLREYLDLEHMRFRDKFSYSIFIDDTLDCDSLCVPNMLIQPQLENAIWHGLRYKSENGVLTLLIENKDKHLQITVDDTGIGIQQSKELKTMHQQQHNSRGLSNTQERIKLLNELFNARITMKIIEKTGEESGVKVILLFPVLRKSLLTNEYSIQNKKHNR